MQIPRFLTGGQALACGAARAGVGCVAGYPGSPSSATMAALIEWRRAGAGAGCHLEWSANERVALEVAIGASLGGLRALVCTKSVGMNVMVDPLMALNLTPLTAGLVIILGDDPGAYGSQNDQDTRALADLLEVPMVEPDGPRAGLDLVEEAFAASERYAMPVVVRVTRSFDTCRADAGDLADTPLNWQVRRGAVAREPLRYVPYPGNAVAKHHDLHRRLQDAAAWVAGASLNRVAPATAGPGAGPAGAKQAAPVAAAAAGQGNARDVRRGIVSAGFCSSKLDDVIGSGPEAGGNQVGRLGLGGIYPLPAAPLRGFLAAHDEVLVVEENEPYLEQRIAALAHAERLTVRIRGKLTGDVARCGELYRWQIADAVAAFAPQVAVSARFTEAGEAGERPPRRNHCAGCPFGELIDAVQAWLAGTGRDAWLIADPGCLASESPRLGAKYAIGSAAAVAHGLQHAGQDAVALFGDSAFFHAALPALCNAYAQGADLAVIVADNAGAVTTGRQPHPGSGRSALGTPAPRLDMLALARACGASHAARAGLAELAAALPATLDGPGVRVLVVDAPCREV
jgi:indolepyruvate ferredoxin oxidoreductase alpha subunit